MRSKNENIEKTTITGRLVITKITIEEGVHVR